MASKLRWKFCERQRLRLIPGIAAALRKIDQEGKEVSSNA